MPSVWREFSEKHPELFLGTAPSARSRFCSRHADALREAGALLKTPGGTWYAHASKFGPAAYALVLGLPPAQLSKAAARA